MNDDSEARSPREVAQAATLARQAQEIRALRVQLDTARRWKKRWKQAAKDYRLMLQDADREIESPDALPIEETLARLQAFRGSGHTP